MLLFERACVFFSRFLVSRNYKIQTVVHVERNSGVLLSGCLEAFSQRMKRQVRRPMGVEVGATTIAFEHGDLSRAALSETKRTSRSEIGGVTSARWRQIGAIGTKAAFDSLQEDGVPEDRRTATGVDALGADLSDGSNTGVRRIPGNQQVSALTRPLLGRCLPIFTDFSDFLGRLHPRQT